MAVMLNAAEIVLAILIMIGLGAFLSYIGWLKDEHAPMISRLTVYVALPCTILNYVTGSFDRASLISSGLGVLVSLGAIGITMAVGYGIATALRLGPGRRGVFLCMFSLSNSIFIGLPVCKALFGDEAVPCALMYYIANTTVFWSIGNGAMRQIQADSSNWKTKLLRFVPFPLQAFLFSVLLVLAGITLPGFLSQATGYVGNMVTPLSLIYTGMLIMRMIRSRNVRWEKGYAFVLLGRFALAPLAMLVLCKVAGLSTVMCSSLVIQAAMPVMAQTSITAAEMGADAEYAAGGIIVTTVLSLLFIPVYMLLLSYV